VSKASQTVREGQLNRHILNGLVTAAAAAVVIVSFPWGIYIVPVILVGAVMADYFSNKYLFLTRMFFVVGVIAITLLLMRLDTVHLAIDSFSERLINLLQRHGLLGAFLNSFIANASLIVHVPYPPIFMFLASQNNSISYLFALTIIGAVGSTLGELISYLVGRGVGKAIKKDGTAVAWVKRVIHERPRLTVCCIVLVAATPIPDDFFIIPLGLSRYGLKRIILPTLLGKTIMLSVVVFVSHYAYLRSANRFDFNGVDPSLFLLVLVVIAAFVGWQIYEQMGSSDEKNIDKDG